jgi:two-component system OmpR family response regulator
MDRLLVAGLVLSHTSPRPHRRHHEGDRATESDRTRAKAARGLRKGDPHRNLLGIITRNCPWPEGGFDLCRELRAKSATLPIIFLTARDSDFDVISGLRLGADDYLSKDTSLHQLAARIAALFRRIESLKAPASSETVIGHGPLKLESERMRITWNSLEVPLTVTEFWMVHTLVRFPGHVKNRDQLMREAELVVDDATITSHIKRIRKKFIAVAPEFDAIETVHGVGYRWRP